jgi:cobalt-zinc-cadmium resistance protein CzcA
LLFLKAAEKLLQRQDTIFQQAVRSADLRYRTGEGTLLEKAATETQANEMRNLLRQNQADQVIAARQLQAFIVSDNAVNIAADDLQPLPFDAPWDSLSLDNNISLSYYRQEATVAQRRTQVEAAKALPEFIVGYFNQTLIGNQTVNNQDVYFGSNKRFQGFIVGVNIPLWFGPYSARVNASRYAAKAVAANYDAFRGNLKRQFDIAHQEFVKSKNNLAYHQASASPNATLILRQSQLAYEKGEIGYAAHLLNLRQALTIQQGYLQAINQYNQTIIFIEYLTGIK